MAIADKQLTLVEIVNKVLGRLGVDTVSSTADTKHATMLLELLNDLMAEISDFGDWQEMYTEVQVTAQSSVGTYKIEMSAAGVIKNIEEIVWDNDPAPLNVIDKQDIRRLQRVGGYGTPRQFAIVGVSGGNPIFRAHPIPVTAAPFVISLYQKPRIYTTSDDAEVMPFSASLLVQGLYAKAVLEENSGEPTPQYQVAYSEYERMRLEELNRFNSDTGTDMCVTPMGSRYS